MDNLFIVTHETSGVVSESEDFVIGGFEPILEKNEETVRNSKVP